MAKDEQAKEAGQKTQQPSEKVKDAAVQATTVDGFNDLDNNTLIAIVENSRARDATRIAALRELHARPGCQYSGLERLGVSALQAIVKTDTVPEELRAAAADALALPRTADKTSKSEESAKS